MKRYQEYKLIGGILEGMVLGTFSLGIISLAFGIYALWKHHKEKKVYWEYIGILIGPVFGAPLVLLLVYASAKGISPPAVPFIFFIAILLIGVFIANKAKTLSGNSRK